MIRDFNDLLVGELHTLPLQPKSTLMRVVAQFCLRISQWHCPWVSHGGLDESRMWPMLSVGFLSGPVRGFLKLQ